MNLQTLRFLFAATACSLQMSVACTSLAAEPQRWAILIGVNDYANLEDLKFTGQDVEALSSRLAASGFPPQQVFLLRDGAQESKYLPIKSNIEKQLDLVLNLVGRDDLVMFAGDVGEAASRHVSGNGCLSEQAGCRTASRLR